MIVLLQIEKEHNAWIESNESRGDAEPPLPAIEWCTKGTGGGSDHVVVIYDLDRLVKEVLPRFGFDETSVPSFVRKLCRWGFRQVSTVYGGVQKNYSNRPYTSHMYESEHFRSGGNLALLSRMRSDTAEKRRYQESLAKVRAKPAASDSRGGKSPPPKSRSKVSAKDKRPRATIKGEGNSTESPRTPEVALRSRDVKAHSRLTADDIRNLISLHRRVNQHQVPTQTANIPASALVDSGLAAAVSRAARQAAFAQRPRYSPLQQQALLSARLAAASQLLAPLPASTIQASRFNDLPRLQLLSSPIEHQRAAILRTISQQPLLNAPSFGRSVTAWPEQGAGSSDLSVHLIAQLLGNARRT
jgi:HSF-type DNA-binding